VAARINVFGIGLPITLGVGLLAMLLTLPLMKPPFAPGARSEAERAAVRPRAQSPTSPLRMA
jgi:flagellar biosynthesis protein FliR